jgi:CubicO group peptidase (beta-lactamase class C family)
MGLSQRVDAVIDAALEKRVVGCVVLVHDSGQQVYARAAGWADREAGLPVRANTIFRLASVTKPIVAAAALRMIDLGLLSLDDPVTKYLPFFDPAPHHAYVRNCVRQDSRRCIARFRPQAAVLARGESAPVGARHAGVQAG